MIELILLQFPAHAHPLTLVADPDSVLRDESILAALADRGFTLVDEPNPVHLCYQVERAKPFTGDHPVIVVCARSLRELPYDLWQQGHHVNLALPEFFPNLVPPVVRALTPPQRWKLSLAPAPERALGRQASEEYVLRHVFGAEESALRDQAGAVAWLNEYHEQGSALPPMLAERVLAWLGAVPAFTGRPLAELLASRDAFAAFVREQWITYVQQQTGHLLQEAPVRYVLAFATDRRLQESVPSLLRSGALEPVTVEQPDRLPAWARAGLIAPDEDYLPRRLDQLLGVMRGFLAAASGEARWDTWRAVARAWAELTATYYRSPTADRQEDHRSAYRQLLQQLDALFLEWLRRRYALLAGQRLPVPHHLFHVPDYIAYERRRGHDVQSGRVALVILDGMSLADWYLIGQTWRARHPDWRLEEDLLLAQVPTITAVSRQALVSGLRPAEFRDTLHTNQDEPRLWTAFWRRQDLPAAACAYARLALDRQAAPGVLDSPHVQALCLVDDAIDELAHSATMGAVEARSSLRLWLEQESPKLEAVLAGLLARRFAVFLASDHGHVEARGMGQPFEGLAVQTRGRRARLYGDERAAQNARHSFPDTILWSRDGVLPDNLAALMPSGRNAFATFNELVVTHGGPTLDEVVVPLVTITLRNDR